jgi:hypothetical protein
MPSIDDVYAELQNVNTNLRTVQAELTQVNNSVNTGVAGVLQGMQKLIELAIYGDQALAHLSQQDDTIICNLEKVSEQTCALLNEAHTETELQRSIAKSSATLVELYKSAHAAGALEIERLERLQKLLLECCPPDKPKPVCIYEPCKAPPPLGGPPQNGPPIQ